jgi:hypothetical protein
VVQGAAAQGGAAMKKHSVRERGQALVLVALLMVVFMGMLMLVLDGGMMYLHRRNAQNAADAGALAGAAKICQTTPDNNAAITAATTYAKTYNSATDIKIGFPETRTIVVTTTVTTSSFFANVFGQSELTAKAVAAAGCSGISTGTGHLPFAFPCIPPEIVGDDDNDNKPRSCDLKYGPQPENRTLLATSETFWEEYCATAGVDCSDILRMADRGWLDFDGKNSNTGDKDTDIKDFIDNGFQGELTVPSWLPSFPGTVTEGFKWITDKYKPGDIFVIPLIELPQCELKNKELPNSTSCVNYEAGDGFVEKGNDIYYRVVAHAYFVYTCALVEGKPPPYEPPCENIKRDSIVGISPSLKTIEGYFITESEYDAGGGGYFAGPYVIKLIK